MYVLTCNLGIASKGARRAGHTVLNIWVVEKKSAFEFFHTT